MFRRSPASDRPAGPALFAAAILLAAAFPAALRGAPEPAASQAPTAPASIDAPRAREIAAAVSDEVERMYVLPETAGKIAAAIREHAARGRYDAAGDVSRLADLLTIDLRDAGHDKHLGVRFSPGFTGGPRMHRVVSERPPGEGSGAGAGAPPAGEGPVRVVRSTGHGIPAGGDSHRDDNFGFRAARRLDGNVGLIDISGFVPLELSRDTAAAAMAFVASTDAVIVDLRDCPGGAPDAVSFLASYFFGPEKRELLRRYDRPMNETSIEYTVADLPGRRMADTDLWILVGPNTASAGESFAYILQQFGRATVVGERSAGAGHNNTLLPVGEGLVLSVSVARPVHPRTGKGWEGEGVRPDVEAPAGRALEVAHAAALRKLQGRAPGAERRRQLAWALERVDPDLRRPAPGAADLGTLAGRYGEREVSVENGSLVSRLAGGRARVLRPVAPDAFSADESVRVTFVRDGSGRSAEMVVDRSDGTRERFQRAPGVSGASPAPPPGASSAPSGASNRKESR